MFTFGADLCVEIPSDDHSVVATISSERISEFRELTAQMLKQNVTPIKALRSYVGKAQSIASLLFGWRPFVSMLWTALFSDGKSRAPSGCIWTQQLTEPLSWLLAFLEKSCGTVQRIFYANAFFNKGTPVIIYVDACPTGIGGWLELAGQATDYFCDKVQTSDKIVLNIDDSEDSKGQQALEALSLLVAMRLWLHCF